MKILLLFSAVSLTIVGHILRIGRFTLILNEKSISKRDSYESLAIGYIFNSFLPIRLGEVARAIRLSGSNIKKFSSAASAIVIERILDGMFLIIVIAIIWVYSGERNILLENLLFPYTVSVLVFLLLITLLISTPNIVKSILFRILNNFPEKITIYVYRFIFNTVAMIKMLVKINVLREVIVKSIVMWFFYFTAYICLSLSLSQGVTEGLILILNKLFTFEIFDDTRNLVFPGVNIFIILILPAVGLLVISYLKNKFDPKFSSHSFQNMQVNGLIFSNSKIEHHFYESYFKSKNREFYKNYQEIFDQCEIVRDESGGSNAVISVINTKEGKFYRKYTFGEGIENLRTQLEFLQSKNGLDNFVTIEKYKITDSIISFDMKFKESSTSLSKACEFINDDFSTGIIDSLIESIVRQSPNKVNTYKDRLLYIESKILNNIELIDENCLELGIDVHKPLKINGFIYPSVYEMVDRFMQSNLDDIFSKDSMILFHGDLTLENIIWDPSAENKYYLIDPNVSSNFNSKESELAKLYQSLKFNYESHKYAEITEIAKNSFLFISHYSNKYSTLKNHLDEQLSRRLSRDRLASINMHSVIHLFRILPYLSHEKNKKKFIVLQIIIGLYELEVNK